jgi:hypothetical protein
MVFTVTLDADDYLEVDLDTFKITEYEGGVGTENSALLTGGDFFKFNPKYGSYRLSSFNMLQNSTNGGAVLIYKRNWKN